MSSKRTGLQKAVHQVEEAIRKSQTQAGDSEAALLDLQELLKTRDVQSDIQVDSLTSDLTPAIPSQRPCTSSDPISSTSEANRNSATASNQSLYQQAETGDLADAENPLQLLAQTSELLQVSAAAKTTIGPTLVPQAMPLNNDSTPATKSSGIDHFFGRFGPKLDVESEFDPIEIGLVTLSEADSLFDLYDGPHPRSRP